MDLGRIGIWTYHLNYQPASNRMVIATGIANIWARDPFTMTAAQLTLSEAYPDRFLLGLGVSHARLVEGIRGHHYQQPFTAMRSYLDGMDQATRAYRAVKPAATPPRVLAALGPRALIRTSSRLSTRQRLVQLSAPTLALAGTVGRGSDRLVDALIAWGDVEAVTQRVNEHLDAGANHVCLQVFDAEPRGRPLEQWRLLAAASL